MQDLKVGLAGIRGRVDSGLDIVLCIDLCSAFATWLERGPVLVARDTRPSSPMLAHAALSALSSAGLPALELGICPTAIAQLEAARLGAGGLISITASHSPAAWNGLKLFGPGGRVLAPTEAEEVLDLWHQSEFRRAPHHSLGALRRHDGAVEHYLDALLEKLDLEVIARARLRIVVDACNGAAAVALPPLCRRLGVELIPVHGAPSGIFPHLPDPSPENLAGAAAIVGPVGAQAGFGLSSDAERVSLITEEGEALGGGATLPLLVEVELGAGGAGRPVVASVTSDSRVERVAARHGSRVVRCGVGAMSVLGRMEQEGSPLGGESSGGVAITRLQLAYDGLACIAWLLQRLASGQRASELAAALPPVHARSRVVPCPVSHAYSVVARIRALAEGPVSELDGVRVQVPGGWYYVRVSQTEPVIRILCEASGPVGVEALLFRVERQVRDALGGA